MIEYKQGLLRRAYAHFKSQGNSASSEPGSRRSGSRMPSVARRLHALHGDQGAFRRRQLARLAAGGPAAGGRAALGALAGELADEVRYHVFLQWAFWDQWDALKRHCAEKGIKIIGDVPIFVAEDSADVWANPEQFRLDAEGNPVVIAGVPPDLFSGDGQRWGNPHYNWDQMRRDGFKWWIERIQQTLRFVDIVRDRPFPRVRRRLGDPRGRGDGGEGEVGEGAGPRAVQADSAMRWATCR